MNHHDAAQPTTKERSFDTAETSTSSYSLDLLLNSPASNDDSLDQVLNSPPSNDDELDRIMQGVDVITEEDLEEKSSSAGSDNTAAIQNGNGLGCCSSSKMESVHIPRNIKDLYSSAALMTPYNKGGNEQQPPPADDDDDDDDISSSLSSYFQNLIGFKKNSQKQKEIKNSPWKEDKPFDEESILESELGEGVEAIYGIGVYTGFNSKNNDNDNDNCIPPQSYEENQGTTADATCKMASGAADPGDSGKSFRCRLLCLLLVLVLVILALVLGLRHREVRGSNKQQQQEFSQVLGSDTTSGGLGPSASPTPGPAYWENPSPSNSPMSSSGTEAPVEVSVLPSSQPTPTTTTSLSPTPAPALPSPSAFPTTFPTNLPTVPPTLIPTTTPTLNPTTITPTTPAPTNCQTTISVDRLCYEEKNDSVVVEFFVCNPQEGDWVGIYLEEDATASEFLGDDFMSWSYTCGGRRCTDPTQQNQFGFLTVDDAPLTGYRVVLISGSDGANPPFTSIAMSDSFVIAEDCS